MRINRHGWLDVARRIDSPNCDERPAGTCVELLVLHNISLPPGVFGGDEIERFFTNTLDHDAHPFFVALRDVRVSTHFLIRRQGEILQFVPTGKRAWHAGVSCWRGRERCNDFSIGIELEGADKTPYEAPQYEALVALARTINRLYRLAEVVGHSDIAPGRKTDPGGAFDWPRFRSALVRRRSGRRG